MTEPLTREALTGDPVQVARRLLGARIVHEDAGGTTTVRLTEVEAYAGADDPGSHAYRGRTPRTEVMFSVPGRLYVYFSYGMHWCANVVCGTDGVAAAVLLRAGEVVDGVEVARSRRPAARRDVDLARGPARLTAALGIHGTHGGTDLCAPGAAIRLEAPSRPADAVRSGPRVGVSGPGGDAAGFPWRFWIDGDPTVSVYRPAQPRRRAAPGGETLAADRNVPAGRTGPARSVRPAPRTQERPT